jgi:sarcosine oxidase subunit gamma
MPDPTRRESPLVRFDLAARAKMSPDNAGVVARERAFLGHLNVRGDSEDPRFAAAVSGVLGCGLPLVANTVSEAAGNTVYWLGPNEWLIVTAGERKAAVESELRTALADLFAAVTDLSGGQTVVLLRGRAIRDVLAKGCPLDLNPRAFGAGRCAQSHLAKAPILLRQVDDEPSFEIVVRRSFADYFWLWLEDAAAEYGLAVAA